MQIILEMICYLPLLFHIFLPSVRKAGKFYVFYSACVFYDFPPKCQEQEVKLQRAQHLMFPGFLWQTMISAVDTNLITNFKMAAESAAQLFSRLGSRQPLNGLDSIMFSGIPNGIQPGDVIEFHGAEGCGKTEMLLHLIANCVLPETWNDIKLGGRGVQVIFIDTDFHFQILRLVAILECRIENAKKESSDISCDRDAEVNAYQNVSTSDIEEFIKTCLSRLYVLRCNNSLEVLTSLISLEQMLMAKPEVSVIMIDSLSAFYWIDRSKGGESTNDQEENMKKIITTIKKYAKDFLLVVIVTTHTIFSSSLKSAEPYFCRSWSSVVKYKYLFSRKDEYAYSAHAVSPQAVFIAQRTLPRSNQFQKFYCTDKGVEFRS